MSYIKFLPDVGYAGYTRRQLPGVVKHIAYRDRGEVLATDPKRGLWYFTDDFEAKRYYYGPFPSKQEAGRAYDRRRSS